MLSHALSGRRALLCGAAWLLAAVLAAPPPAAATTAPATQSVLVDTDIGDDIDDAFALSLLLASPEIRVAAITASFGDTALRARMLRRLLRVAGRDDIAVFEGPPTRPGTRFTQSAWAAGGPAGSNPAATGAVSASLALLRALPPGRITLLALAPLTTVGAMIDRDPVAFRRLARVVVMAGSIRHGYGRRAGTVSSHPSLEYNARCDPDGMRRLLASGVPVELLPTDATEVALDGAARRRLFGRHTRLTDMLATLYGQWARRNPWGGTPVLFDVVPVARMLRPAVCAPRPERIAVSPSGVTRPVAGRPNLSACLTIDRAAVLSLLEQRLLSPAAGDPAPPGPVFRPSPPPR